MKNLRRLLFVSLCLFSIQGVAQYTCGFDDMISITNSDSLSKANFDTIRTRIRATVAEIRALNNPNFKIQQNNYVIPVVFHLVGSSAATLTDAQVTAQLNLLNSAFSNSLGSVYSSADDAQIKFCLAQKLPNGNAWSTITSYNSNLYTGSTAGITRCTTSVANTVSYNHHMATIGTNSQTSLLNIAYTGFSTSRYLNIWVVERISMVPSPYINSVAGYGVFPGNATAIDGVVMRLSAFGINTTYTDALTSQGTILAHETGHFLGLFHTFQNGCAGTTTATCYSAGDECCDTPPVLAANQNSCSVFSSSPPNTCSETPNLPDMYENHMDYQYDNAGNCRNTFTNDQADRMHASIQLYRATLVSYPNHVFTGLTNVGGCQASAINPGFVTNLPNASVQVCTGQSIGFIAGSSATTYTWSFPGGSPSSATGTNTPTGITYSSPGVYNVTLNITDGSGNNYSSTLQIFASSCSTVTGSRANWYFSNQASVSFSSGIATSQSPSGMITDESSASVSNSSGNLLFYTNGNSVYNNTHASMTNGNNTLNGSPNGVTSSGQGVVIVPRPGNANKYYIYTTSDTPVTPSLNLSFGVSQYEVDMTSLPGTVTSTIPVNPSQNYATNEPIVAIPHCNGTDYWVCVKPRNNNQNGLPSAGSFTNVNQFIAAYLVTSSGISNTPVLSPSSPYSPSATFLYGNDGRGNIAVSPDKSMICFGDLYTNKLHVYNFDCSTGKTNYIAGLNGANGAGFAFSPNSKVLYASSNISNSIVQYDLTQLSVCNPNPPTNTFPVGFNGFPSLALQLGPDNRIYLSHLTQGFLSVINFPDNVNTAGSSNECGYNYAAIPLISPSSGRLDLPNDIISQAGQTTDEFSFCLANCGQAKFTNLGCGTNFSWNFGDGYSISAANGTITAGTNGGTTTGNYEYPVHTYSSTGTYVATLSIDGRTNVSHTVTISTAPTPTITGPDIICTTNTNTPISYYAPVGYTYNWSTANGTPSVSTQQNVDITWFSFPAVLTLTITNGSGCSAVNSLTVYISSNISATASPSTVCPTAPTTTLSASGTASYTWMPGNITGNTAVVTPTATTIYTVTGLTTS